MNFTCGISQLSIQIIQTDSLLKFTTHHRFFLVFHTFLRFKIHMLFIRTTCVTKTKSIQHIKDGNYAIRLHSVASSARYPVISDPSGFGCLESTGAKLIIISYSQVRLPGLAVVGFRYEFQVACKRASLSKHVYIYFPTKNRTISLIRKGFIEVLFQVYTSPVKRGLMRALSSSLRFGN